MDSHPSYGALEAICAKYPKHSQSLFQTYNDILYTQQWVDVQIDDVPLAQRAVISGRRNHDEPLRVVAPCSLTENLSIEWLNKIFDNHSPPPSEVWIGIVGDDSSLVYYKLSKGIVKPPM